MKCTTKIHFVAAGVLTLAVAATPLWAAPPDAWITTKAKIALLTTEGVNAGATNVDTVNGRVTLHGKVNTAQESDNAAATVAKIDGVTGVRNLLQVVPSAQEEMVKASDDEIKRRTERALKADRALSGSSIQVQSVNDGVVLLAGTAKTLTAHLRAVEIASTVRGVRRIASEVQSPDKLADAEIWHERKSGGDDERGVSATASDLWITSATKMRLLADSKTPALDINVDTRNGIVTLFGMVPSPTAKAAAEADARKVSGIKHVVNELQIVPTAKQDAVKARDDDVQKQVKAALQNRDELKSVNVEVKNGVARLTGSVPGGIERLEAAVLARSTEGVRSVRDDLRVAD